MDVLSLDIAAEVASWILIALGSFFVVVGGLGLMRLPDVYTRIHAVSLIDSAGAALLLFGFALQAGWTLITAKLVFIFLLILFTGPVATHALSQAALVFGIKPQLAHDRRGAKAGKDKQ